MTSGKLRVLVLLFLSAFVYALPGHADSSASYGSGLGSDGLANTVVGGQWGNIVSYRFRAGHSGALQQIHVYLIQNHVGYSAGTGGQLQVTVNADDGTTAHNPSSTVLASYLLSNPLAATPSIYFPIFVFSAPPTLVQGQLYHIVFTNVDPSPTTNYLSVDALYLAKPSTPAQPTISDVDAAELLGGPAGTWTPRKGYTPILELDYQDRWSEFIGYMEVWVGVPQSISGSSAVRETIALSGAQKTVSSASIRVARTGGSDPLIVRLENGDGTVIEQGEVPASSIPLTSPASYVWATFTFSSAHTLLAGQSYHLQLSAASTSSYQAYPIRKGVAYGFQNTTYFPDGYAQFNQNGSWVGWTQWGVSNRTDGDLQFYFSLASSNAAAPTISNLAAGSLTSNSATITWTTDQSSTSQVEYGTTTSYSNITAVDSNSVTSHSEVLTGLVASTLYHYRVHSVNSSGVEAISGDLTFTTLAAPAPVISNVVAGSITSSGASITWSTDQASSSQVEYGTTTAYGSMTTLDQTLVTSHSQALTGLLAATAYHYRVHSTNASGTQGISGDFTFTTLAAPAPVISNVVAGSITSSGASITWSTDQVSSSQMEYGTTTAYGSMTTLDQTLVTNHSQALTGLLAATVYHYRVRSTNASGTQGISGDLTFTTLAAPAPVISNVVAGSITSNGASITWSTDQASSSQVEYGTTTAYGSMTTLDQTLVTSHSQALTGLLAATAYHYRVHSTNASGTQGISGDFTFTTLAAPAPVISNVVAGSITSNGASITWSTDQVSSSQVEYGTTTAYGSMTTLDQTLVTSHSQALTGLLAATVYHYRVRSTNASGTQGISGDLTFTTLAAPAPVISNVVAGSITSNGASITWSTDQVSSSQVEYGTTTAYGSMTTLDQTLVTSHSQALTGLLAATIYHYRVHSTNASGTQGISGDFTFTTLAAPAPVISNVVAGSVTSNGATITWSTDQVSSSQVEYGTTIAYGSMTTLDQTLVTSHSQALVGLLAATAYHYRVRSTNASGAQGISGDFTFTTLAAPAPIISNVVAGSITSSGASITWSTDQASSSQVEYGTTTAYGSMTTLNQTLVTSHSQALTGLLAATAYHYRVHSTNASGTQGISGDFTFTTLAAPAPVISNVVAGSITSSGASITWSTDQVSSSQVEYGTTTAYGSMTTLDPTLVTSHSQALVGLLAATAYHYRVHSTNASGTQGISGDLTFTTLAAPAPVISNVVAGSITSNGASITWSTDQASSSQVEYGTTTAYGSMTTLNQTLVTSHSQALTGFLAGTLCHYRVRSTNAAGLQGISGDFTFTTRGKGH